MRKKSIMIILTILALSLFQTVALAKQYDYSVPTDGYIGDDFCSTTETVNTFKLIGMILLVAKLAIPLIIVGVGIFDLYKGISSGKNDDVSKGAKAILTRVAIGIVVFFIPNIFGAILGGLLPEDYKQCSNCLFFPNNNCVAKTYDNSPSGEKSPANNKVCGSYGDLTSCNSDTSHSCNWDYSSNSCVVKSS